MEDHFLVPHPWETVLHQPSTHWWHWVNGCPRVTVSIVFEAPGLNRKASCSCLRLQLRDFMECFLLTVTFKAEDGAQGGVQEHQASTSAFTGHQSNDGLFNECPWERCWFWRGLQSWLFVSLFWQHKLTDHDSPNRGNWRVVDRRSRKPGQRLKYVDATSLWANWLCLILMESALRLTPQMFAFPCRRDRDYRITWDPKRMAWSLATWCKAFLEVKQPLVSECFKVLKTEISSCQA